MVKIFYGECSDNQLIQFGSSLYILHKYKKTNRHLKPEIALAISALNDEKYIDRKGIPPGPYQGEYPSYLCIFRHLKLEIALAITA